MHSHNRRRVIQGNEAAMEGAFLAGCRFFAGYPITPATELAEVAAARLPEMGGIYMQMEDELASINLLVGASWAGKKVMTATSGPGFNLMQEGISYAFISQAPCVIVNVQRGGPAAGQATLSSQQDVYQARYGCNGEYEPIVLAPSSAQECLDMTIRAFNLAEKYLTPVIVLMDEIVGHTREPVVIPDSIDVFERRRPPENYPFRTFEPIEALGGVPYRVSVGEGRSILVESQIHDEMGCRASHLPDASAACLNRLLNKIRRNVDDIIDVTMDEIEGADVILVGYGSTARAALRAARDARAEGKKVGFIKLNTVFPFPEKELAAVLDKCANDVVFAIPEMNSGKVYRDIKLATGCEVISLPKLGGELHKPSEIFQRIWG